MHLLNCNYGPNIKPCQYESREIGEILDNTELKLKDAEDFSKIIELLNSSDIKNKRIAIKLARVVFRFDCYDLCQYMKKLHFMGKRFNQRFVQALRFIEWNLSGYREGSISYELDGKCSTTMARNFTIELYSIHNYDKIKLHLNEESGSMFYEIYNSKKYKANPFRTLLLNM